jgi:hypothetical protein
MRVEVQIGTIEIDALPKGMSPETLRSEIVHGLEGCVLKNGVPGYGATRRGASEDVGTPGNPPSQMGIELAHKIYRGIWQSSNPSG